MKKGAIQVAHSQGTAASLITHCKLTFIFQGRSACTTAAFDWKVLTTFQRNITDIYCQGPCARLLGRWLTDNHSFYARAGSV